MTRTLLTALLTVLLFGSSGIALEITSVVPTRATPDTPVLLTGGMFSEQSRIYLGEWFVPPTLVLPRQIEFIVPPLPPGSYSLTVQDEVDTAVQPFNFEVLAPHPQIAALAPENLDVCTDEAERLVRVAGNNFQSGALVLLNGTAMSSRFIDAGTLEFRLAELPAGVYGVEVRNPDGTASLPHSLWVNSVPEISSVERGDDFVNHYQVIIRGKNFFYNSILSVRETNISAGGTGTLQRAYYAHRRDPALSGGILDEQGGKLLYNDCRTLVYQRYPSNFQDKELILQVINPDGKKTSPHVVTLP